MHFRLLYYAKTPATMETLGLLSCEFFVLLTFIAPCGTAKCPFSWVPRGNNLGCYFFGIHTLRTWAEARQHCMSMEGDLLRVDDPQEQQWMMTKLRQLDRDLPGVQEWWTGLKRDPTNQVQWVWADNSRANNSFLAWGQGEPNNFRNNEGCAEIWDRTFNDKRCSMPLNYVCERPIDIPEKCDSSLNWEYHHGMCYRMYKTPVLKNQARDKCREGQDWDLLQITDDNSQQTATEMARSYNVHVWLSVNYISLSRRWVSIDRTDTETLVRTFYWQTDEPSLYDGVDSCVGLNDSAPVKNNWYAENCTETKSFICQRPAGMCPAGYISFGQRCYVFKDSRRDTWQSARQYCENEGSNLLEINSPSEMSFIMDTITRPRRRSLQRLWIGLVKSRNPDQGSEWFWVSKNGYFSPQYLNVDPRNSGRESCVYLDADVGRGKWYNDISCDQTLSFVCYQYNNMAEENRPLIAFTRPPTTIVPTTQITSKTTPPSPTMAKTTRSPVTVITRGPVSTRRTPIPPTPSTGDPGGRVITAVVTKVNTPLPTTAAPVTTPYTTTMLTTTTSAPIWDPLCGPYFVKNPNSPFCYMTTNRLYTWQEGREICQGLGADLLSINTIEEQHYLTGRLSAGVPMWTGGYQRGEEAGWQWTDDSPFAYLNFYIGEPNIRNGSDQCIALAPMTSRWMDRYCDERLGVICKKRAVPPIPDIPLTSPPFVTGDKYYGCPPGWVAYKLTCFLVVRNKTSWHDALTSCRTNGGDLASLKDEGEHDFVLSQLPKGHCYNFYHDDQKCDKWAGSGECDRNPVWMAQKCQRSCAACLQECKDIYPEQAHCRVWARLGECDKNHRWMLKNCAMSCGVCDAGIYGGFWIGLNDVQQYRVFRWTDHSNVRYTYWGRGEPNNFHRKGERCVMMTLKNGRWNDYNCDEIMPGYVCKTNQKILTKPTVSPLSVGCTNGSLGYNAYCYSFIDVTESWNDARDICSNQGGSLATVNDRYVQAFLASQLVGKKQSYWIGLSQDYSSGVIEQWVSGQSVQFTYWSDKHTGGDDEDGLCVSMTTSHPVGLWDTSNCSISRPFICEFPRDGYTTTTPSSTTPPPSTIPPSCPGGWLDHGQYCYKVSTDLQSWIDASKICQQYGAELTSVHSSDEQQFLTTYFKNSSQIISGYSDAWIGLNDRSSENGFSWSDGTPFDFTEWGPSEPDDGGLYTNEDCVTMLSTNGEWVDDNCFKSKPYICRIQRGAPFIPESNVTRLQPVFCKGDPDWLYLRTGGRDMCYYFSDTMEDITWYEARDLCRNMGADLVSVTSRDILDFLMSQATKDIIHRSFWIGLNDIKHSGFVWSDGSFVNFLNWDELSLQYRDETKKCAYQRANTGRWFVLNCNAKLERAVCQRANTSSDVMTTPSTTPPLIVGGCLTGYAGSPISNKCYKVLEGPFTFSEASRQCAVEGNGVIATINSALENSFITSLASEVSGTGLWIGLHRLSVSGVFGWKDNGRLGYTNWFAGEPSGNEDCVEMFINRDGIGNWNDAPCWKSRGAVCQTQKNPVYPTLTSSDPRCPQGFAVFGTSCYKLVLTAQTRDSASISCVSMAASLVSIQDEYEQSFVDVFMRNIEGPYWIGLQRKIGNDFTWDGDWPYGYNKWDQNEPSFGPQEKCVVIEKGQWKDITCDVKLPSLCEYSLVSPPTTPPPGICPENTSSYKGFCYYVEVTQSRSWIGADQECKSIGMELASIHSEAELEHIQNVAKVKSGQTETPKLWIGLTRRLFAYGFGWTDGTPLDFLKWEEGEPSDVWEEDEEDCVEMYGTGTWNDVNCQDYNKNYVCKMKQISMTTMNMANTEATTANNNTTGIGEITTSAVYIQPTGSQNTEGVPYKPRAQVGQKPRSNSETSSLTAGQIVGILIGIVLLGVLVAGVVYIYVRTIKSATYSTESHGFSNALYHKTEDNISISDSGSITSQSKIVKGGFSS